MAINISVQYNGGLLSDIIILLTRGYYHRGARLCSGFVFPAYYSRMFGVLHYFCFVFAFCLVSLDGD